MAVYQEKDKSKWTKDGRSWYFRCYYPNLISKAFGDSFLPTSHL